MSEKNDIIFRRFLKFFAVMAIIVISFVLFLAYGCGYE
jgi:hypothetical protein